MSAKDEKIIYCTFANVRLLKIRNMKTFIKSFKYFLLMLKLFSAYSSPGFKTIAQIYKYNVTHYYYYSTLKIPSL
jgi:hypothetical protein